MLASNLVARLSAAAFPRRISACTCFQPVGRREPGQTKQQAGREPRTPPAFGHHHHFGYTAVAFSTVLPQADRDADVSVRSKRQERNAVLLVSLDDSLLEAGRKLAKREKEALVATPPVRRPALALHRSGAPAGSAWSARRAAAPGRPIRPADRKAMIAPRAAH
jgi:hypothetical protein